MKTLKKVLEVRNKIRQIERGAGVENPTTGQEGKI